VTDALKPCPFCGSDGVEALDMEGKHYVVCYDCALEGPFHKSRAAVIAAWNTRAALAAPAVPPQKPLHIEALNDAWEDRDRDYVRCFHSFAAGVSVAERAHGILLPAAPTAQQEPKP